MNNKTHWAIVERRKQRKEAGRARTSRMSTRRREKAIAHNSL